MSSSPSPSYLKRSVRSIVFPRYLSLRFAAIDRAGKSREKKRGEKAEEWISGIDVSLDARCGNAYHPTKFYRCRKSEVTVFQAVVHTGQASQIFTLIFWDSLVPRATLFPPRWTRNFVGDGFSRERRFQQRWKEDCVCEKEEKRRSFLLIIIIRVLLTIISNFVSYSFRVITITFILARCRNTRRFSTVVTNVSFKSMGEREKLRKKASLKTHNSLSRRKGRERD